jgi:subtilisin family serine protease
VLSIAAAGNDGNTVMSYPASYDSVVSVAAIDSDKQHASFSQYNSQVDISAPGVQVLSSVPFIQAASLTVSGTSYSGHEIEGAPRTPGVTGALVDGGICDSVGTWVGKVVLCQRGTIDFATKVSNVQKGGGVAAVIYNNVSGGFSGTMGATATTTPAISLSQEDGTALVASSLGVNGTVTATFTTEVTGYEAWDGTSMATPHVSAVAALVWSYNPSWTNTQVRNALEKSAQDLGPAGRDNEYGHGLVQAKAALDYLNLPSVPGAITLSVTPVKKGAQRSAKLSWSGATGATVDVFRDSAKIASPANSGSYTDKLGTATGTFVYQVCNTNSSTCSPNYSITF